MCNFLCVGLQMPAKMPFLTGGKFEIANNC